MQDSLWETWRKQGMEVEVLDQKLSKQRKRRRHHPHRRSHGGPLFESGRDSSSCSPETETTNRCCGKLTEQRLAGSRCYFWQHVVSSDTETIVISTNFLRTRMRSRKNLSRLQESPIGSGRRPAAHIRRFGNHVQIFHVRDWSSPG